MSSSNNTPMSSVIGPDGRCAGFLMRRRPGEIEAYTADVKPIGSFTDTNDAIAAVLNRKAGR